MNHAHNGVHLGQTLYKLIKRVDCLKKVSSKYLLYDIFTKLNQVGWFTSDNASNNTTMMQEFARLYKLETREEFDWKDCWIRYSLFLTQHIAS